MQTADVILRLYKMTDAEMLEAARVTVGFFKQDIVDLSAFDPTLADPFIDDYLTEINDIEQIDSDSVVLDQQTQVTLSVEDAMKNGRNGYQTLKYFIERSFPNRTAVWNEFGYNDYAAARASQPSFIQFLIQLHKTAVKYTTELTAVGYDAARIATLAVLAQQLQDLNTKQELFKGTRPVTTQERVIQLNKIWSTLSRIRKAGKITYLDNFAKQQRYLGISTTVSKPITEGKVAPNAVSNALNGGFAMETALNLRNTGDTALRFGLCQTATEVPAETGITINAGAEKNITIDQLGDFDATYTFVNVVNLSAIASGSYELTILE